MAVGENGSKRRNEWNPFDELYKTRTGKFRNGLKLYLGQSGFQLHVKLEVIDQS